MPIDNPQDADASDSEVELDHYDIEAMIGIVFLVLMRRRPKKCIDYLANGEIRHRSYASADEQSAKLHPNPITDLIDMMETGVRPASMSL